MHDSSIDKLAVFRHAYLAPYEEATLDILDVGSAVAVDTQSANRAGLDNPNWTYRGLDIVEGPNVDVAVREPYDWREVPAASVDVVTSSQVFEHVEFPWLTILEIGRVLKVGGLAFIIAPGGGEVHRYPNDCWRYYPDGLPALAKWAGLTVVEAHQQWSPAYSKGGKWRDAAIVLQRPRLSPVEETSRALRTRLAKLALAESLDPAAAELAIRAFIDAGETPEAPASVIAPVTSLDAFAARERELLKSTGAIRRRLLARHLRGAVRAIRKPVDDLTDPG
jgi:SAM-dependent methyltransferase